MNEGEAAAMSEGVRFEAWVDESHCELQVAVSHSGFSGHTHVWCDAAMISAFAEALEAYPLVEAASFRVSYGGSTDGVDAPRDPVVIQVRPANRRGQLSADVLLETGRAGADRKYGHSSVRVVVPVTHAGAGEFATQLRQLAGEGGIAVLPAEEIA